MKVTKLVHSCLLIEEGGVNVLLDPGIYSWESEKVNVATIDKLDHIFITHPHADHYSLDFLGALLEKFPDVQIVSNQEIVEDLRQHSIEASAETPDFAESFTAQHEELPWGIEPPQNTGFHLWNKLTDPGDSFAFTKTNEVLALPIQAPWGAPTQAFKKALELKPQRIIPVHDYHWRDSVRESFYLQAEEFFKRHDIEFLALENGEQKEV